jgi:hypothetical protein
LDMVLRKGYRNSGTCAAGLTEQMWMSKQEVRESRLCG